MIKLEQSSNLLVSHAFTCWVLVCFLSHLIIFAKGERANTVTEGCSEKIQKLFLKTLVIEYFHSKLAEILRLKTPERH